MKVRISKSNLITVVIYFLLAQVLLLGIGPIFYSPVVSDDLIILVKTLADLSEGNYVSSLVTLVKTASSPDHFLPFGGFLTFVQAVVLDFLSGTEINPVFAWATLRFIYILVSLTMFALFMQKCLKSKLNTTFIEFFALTCFSFIAFTQVHANWLHDPIVSFGLAGFGTASIGFLYLYLLVNLSCPKSSNSFKSAFTLGLFGLLGIFNSEVFLAFIFAGIPFLITKSRNYFLSGKQKEAIKLFLPVLIPVFVFFMIQIWRIINYQNLTYDGTQVGTLEYFLPNLYSGLLSSLPLAYLSLATKYVGYVQIREFIVPIFTLAAAMMIWIANKKKNLLVDNSDTLILPKNSLNQSLLILWLTSTAMFAISSKYQEVMNADLGRVYLFYVFGNFTIIGFFIIWFLSYKLKAKIFGALIVTLIGIYTYNYNEQLMLLFKKDPVVSTTQKIMRSYNYSTPHHIRCELLETLVDSTLPEYYLDEFMGSFTKIYFEQNNVKFCLKEITHL